MILRLPDRNFEVAEFNVHKQEDDGAGFEGFGMTELTLKAIRKLEGYCPVNTCVADDSPCFTVIFDFAIAERYMVRACVGQVSR